MNTGLEDCVCVCFMLFKFILITPVECIVNVQLHMPDDLPPECSAGKCCNKNCDQVSIVLLSFIVKFDYKSTTHTHTHTHTNTRTHIHYTHICLSFIDHNYKIEMFQVLHQDNRRCQNWHGIQWKDIWVTGICVKLTFLSTMPYMSMMEIFRAIKKSFVFSKTINVADR